MRIGENGSSSLGLKNFGAEMLYENRKRGERGKKGSSILRLKNFGAQIIYGSRKRGKWEKRAQVL